VGVKGYGKTTEAIPMQADSLTAVGVKGCGKATEAIPMQADSLTAVVVKGCGKAIRLSRSAKKAICTSIKHRHTGLDCSLGDYAIP